MPNNENAPTVVEASPNVQTNYTVRAESLQVGDDLFPPTEPWPELVSGQELADEIKALLSRYLHLPKGTAEALTLWVFHTYAPDCFDFTPRVCITSPEPRCGKTTLLALLEYLSFQTVNVSSITPAAMFRIIEKCRPTLLIDEADAFLKDNNELRGIINAGYKRDGKVIRTEKIGQKYVPQFFNCFAPCAIAAIGKIPETIKDRSVLVVMARKTKGESAGVLRTREIMPTVFDIRRKCLRFMTDNAEQIATLRPTMPEHFNDRAADIWEPLFAIATVISPEWESAVKGAANALVGAQVNEDELSTRTQLLSDIRSIFADCSCDWLGSDTLVEALVKIEGSPWGEWNSRYGFNVHALAGQLKYFGIKPYQSREGGRSRRYCLADFQDAFARYLPSDCASVPEAEETVPTESGSNPPLDADRHTGTVEIGDCVNDAVVDNWP